MNLRQAAKMALEALEGVAQWVEKRPNLHPWDAWQRVEPAIAALRAALAEPDEPDETGLYHNRIHEEMPNSRPAYAVRAGADEPYLYVYEWDTGRTDTSSQPVVRSLMAAGINGVPPSRAVPLYTHPPRREPLTEEQIGMVQRQASSSALVDLTRNECRTIARAVERAHGIGTDE